MCREAGRMVVRMVFWTTKGTKATTKDTKMSMRGTKKALRLVSRGPSAGSHYSEKAWWRAAALGKLSSSGRDRFDVRCIAQALQAGDQAIDDRLFLALIEVIPA